MSDLKLREMSSAQAAEYRARLEVGYAEQQARFGGYTEVEAYARAKESLDRLWPLSGPTDGHHLWVAEVDGQAVGTLWLAEESPNGRQGQAWIYEIAIKLYESLGFRTQSQQMSRPL